MIRYAIVFRKKTRPCVIISIQPHSINASEETLVLQVLHRSHIPRSLRMTGAVPPKPPHRADQWSHPRLLFLQSAFLHRITQPHGRSRGTGSLLTADVRRR